MGGTPLEETGAHYANRGDPPDALKLDQKVTAAAVVSAFCIAIFAILADNGIELSTITVQSSTAALTLLAGYLMPNGRHNR